MSRLIDVNALTDDVILHYLGRPYSSCLPDIRDMLDETPTIDAEPVVHAHWYIDRYGLYHCSRCGGEPLEHETGCFVNRHYEQKLSDFCPRCGAVMDEVIEND